MDIAKFAEFGLAGLVIAAFFALFWRMVVWAMAWFKEKEAKLGEELEKWEILYLKQLESGAQERDKWHSLHECHQKILDKIIVSLERHDEKAEERGKFVREEHREFLANQEILKKGLTKVAESLDQTEKALGRINGYNHE